MEDLIILKEYAAKFNISWHTCRNWLNNGLKHIGTRPYRTKIVWINEFLEDYSKKQQEKIIPMRKKIRRHSTNKTVRKLDINDYI